MLKIVVCALCTEEPFLCPERFRRSYMRMHIEKAHEVVPGPSSVVRRVSVKDRGQAVWTIEREGVTETILTEFELPLPRNQQRPEATEEAPHGSNSDPSLQQWSAENLQAAYRDRQGEYLSI